MVFHGMWEYSILNSPDKLFTSSPILITVIHTARFNISFEIKSSSEVSRIMFMEIEISSNIFVKVILSLFILILYYIFVINTIDNENFNQEVI